jgi:hypothetical protein
VNGLIWIGIEHNGRKQPLRQVGEGEAVGPLILGSGGCYQRIDLFLVEAKLMQWLRQYRSALFVVRPMELQNLSRAASDRWIEGAEAVCAHYYGGRESTVPETVDAANEGVYAGSVFMVHLRCLSRLSQSVGFIDQ